MSARRPVLGFPSMTAAVVDLRQKGLTTREIGEKVGRDPKSILSLEAAHRKAKALRREMPVVGGIRMAKISDYFSETYLSKLRPHAARRSYSIDMLIKNLVRTTADDAMVDAVLDDVAAEPDPPSISSSISRADEVALLKERLRELENVLEAPAQQIPPEWGMPRREAQLFSLLLIRERVTKEMLAIAFRDESTDETMLNVWESHASKMRKRLRPFGVVIEARRFDGYRLVDRQQWLEKLKVSA